jgi:ABC-type branched-subunit amino acid transport system substrate-binding protein
VPKAEALVLEKGCVALMGPMLKEHVMPVAEAAQAMGVPLIALSQSQDPAEVGDYVFRGFLPPEQQVEALLNHAMGERGLTRFAVMYPMTPYGEAARDLFSSSVARRGGTTVQLTRYDPKSSSFLKPARELKVAWKGGGDEGFQAIFIPDSWRQVSLIASALAYEEMPVGRFRPRGGAPVLLMGLNGWNNPELPRAGGQYLQGAVFVDAFRAESGNPSVEGFVDSYRSSTGRKPTVVEAVTWDATRLLAAATSKAGADREKLKAELAGARISGPVAGGDHFGPDREVARSLQVLTIAGESIRAWETPLPGSP